MNKIYMMLLTALVAILSGCSKENPFENGSGDGEGKLLKSALAVDVKDEEILHQTKAEVTLDNFQVTITKVGQTTPSLSCLYKDMPEIVVLPAGDYVATASLGTDLLAAFDNPYFKGQSKTFTVVANEITSYIDPIVCYLENIKVSIEVDPLLREAMSDDSFVKVKVGDNDGLDYKFPAGSNVAEKVGYFKHTSETSLVATFTGKINGSEVVESKSYQNPQKGHHYKLRFKLHNPSGNDNGEIKTEVRVDASVTVVNVTRNIKVGDDILLDDNERPTEGGETKVAPVIKAKAPFDIETVNTVDGTVPVGISVVSTAAGGFEEFKVVIESPNLTPEELESVGLSANLDLVNPGQYEGPLTNFGFPVNVRGMKSADFEISTSLLGLLAAVGQGNTHKFILTVKDANGTTTKTLQLHIP